MAKTFQVLFRQLFSTYTGEKSVQISIVHFDRTLLRHEEENTICDNFNFDGLLAHVEERCIEIQKEKPASSIFVENVLTKSGISYKQEVLSSDEYTIKVNIGD